MTNRIITHRRDGSQRPSDAEKLNERLSTMISSIEDAIRDATPINKEVKQLLESAHYKLQDARWILDIIVDESKE